MAKHLIVVEDAKDWAPEGEDIQIIDFQGFLLGPTSASNVRVINMCRGYPYLGSGYYCSLMAEARGQRSLPSVRTINDLSRRALYSLDLGDLMPRLDKLVAMAEKGREEGYRELRFNVFFGISQIPELEELGRQIFENLPAPILKVRLKKGMRWRIESVRAIGPQGLAKHEKSALTEAFSVFTNKNWKRPKSTQNARFDLAMLVNPEEKFPPSNKASLNLFIQAGHQLGINVEIIGPKDFGRIAEFDALFLRETTNVNHHTYRFAKKAESEGMVVMDDPTSILRCTNKIFLADLLSRNKVPAPRYRLLTAGKDPVQQLGDMSYPVVVKIPDGSFSRGMFKAKDAAQLREKSGELFKSSSVLLAQEFVYTDYDWRVGMLNRQPIFASRYFMSKGHWQIYKHGSGGRVSSGGADTVMVEAAPKEVLEVATRASGLIGNGLYGVDLKQVGDRVLVIEINDNPSIDHGYEDVALGKELYRVIMAEFMRRLEQRVQGTQPASAPTAASTD
jgi:glutathione synthase/RimK-type ligase-like ATP-grasp enzyme